MQEVATAIFVLSRGEQNVLDDIKKHNYRKTRCQHGQLIVHGIVTCKRSVVE